MQELNNPTGKACTIEIVSDDQTQSICLHGNISVVKTYFKVDLLKDL